MKERHMHHHIEAGAALVDEGVEVQTILSGASPA
jgi:hypothetical protein